MVKQAPGSIVLLVVRGEASLDVLRQIGIEIESEDGFYKLRSGNFDLAVAPTAADIARGLVQYGSGNRNDLRKWAFFLLAECGAIDLSAIESHPQGETLLSALWNASFEGRVSNETIELARRLTLSSA
ncbi:MAG: hypothetical protein ABR555_18815 [Pyrinomonadaceae bacterium]